MKPLAPVVRLVLFGAALSPISCAAGSAPLREGPLSDRSAYASRRAWVNSIDPRTLDAPAGRNTYGAPRSSVTVPMVFPILSRGYSFSDEFGAPRSGHRHLGQDLFAPKMTPVVATFDGTVYLWSRGGVAPHNMMTLYGDNGYSVRYMHINNDTPGTNDGRGGTRYAFAPGLVSGQRVVAGQFLGWVGNSGNAETTPPHVHFELWGPDGMVVNPAASLRNAERPRQARTTTALPDWLPQPGEVRYDGILQAVDTARGVVVLQLVSTTTPRGTVAATRSGRTYLRVSPKAVIRENGDGAAVRFSALPTGSLLALRGKTPAKNRSFVAGAGALIAAGNDYGLPVSEETELANEHAETGRKSLGRQLSDWWNGVKCRGRL